MENKAKTQQANQLIFLGLILFLVGLLVGLFVQKMTNPRMALSAHLEGIMNGMFLVILGLIWTRLVLSKIIFKVTFWLVIYGTFANLVAVILAAYTGFGKMMPIAGGHGGTGIIEDLITFLLLSLALSMIAVCVIVLVGFYKHMKQLSKETAY